MVDFCFLQEEADLCATQPMNPTSALIWLRHCHLFGVTFAIKQCELMVARHFMRLNETDKSGLDQIGAPSLRRISKAYADAQISVLNASRAGSRIITVKGGIQREVHMQLDGPYSLWDSSKRAQAATKDAGVQAALVINYCF